MLMIDLVEGSSFRPGDMLEGVVTWVLRGAPIGGAVELLWTTQGRGDDDQQVVATRELRSMRRPGESSLDPLAAEDSREFSFPLPAGPYSFSGQLITLSWTLRARVRPDGEEATFDITVSPSGEEINLCAPRG